MMILMALNTFQLLSAVEFPLNLLIINAKKNLVGKELSSENRKFSLNVSDTFCELFFVKKKKTNKLLVCKFYKWTFGFG